MDDIKKEITEKVKEKTYSYVSPYQGDYAWKKGWQQETEGTKTTKEKTQEQPTLLRGGLTTNTDTYRKKFREICELEWHNFGPAIKGAYNNNFEDYYQEQLSEDLSLGYGNRVENGI